MQTQNVVILDFHLIRDRNQVTHVITPKMLIPQGLVPLRLGRIKLSP